MREKDIELAFADFLNEHGFQVLAHQVRLPLGTLDILGMIVNPAGVIPVVAEIKLGPINEKACTQLLGYMEQVERVLKNRTRIDPYVEAQPAEPCRGILVGTSLNQMCSRVVSMMKMDFYSYSVVDGVIRFEEHPTFGETPADSYELKGPMLTLFNFVERTKAQMRVSNAAALSSYENYRSLTSGESRPHQFESLETTLAYWRRPR